MARSAFEDAKNAILRESRLNGGLEPQAIFDLIVASNADSAERDQKTITKLDAHAVILANHERANQAREERFVRAEHETLAIAAEEMRQLHELHVKECHTPRAPRRAGDPESEDYSGGRAIVVAERKFTREQVVVGVILFLAVVVSSNLIGALIERLTK